LEDAQLAVELGAAAVGFNFYPLSPRYVAPAVVRDIVQQLPPFVVPVGVFADEVDDEHVARAAQEARVSVVQLHGPSFPSFDGVLGDYPLIRAVAVGADFNPESLRGLRANAFLLDTLDPTLRGGTGRKFDWSLARQVRQFGPVILAGGLTGANVGQAIREAQPFAVDVASGVESSPGIKDRAKLQAFFAAVREAETDY
jgi:phosphoribosylanthranilate isomerase